jgi:hypothetical protein
MLPRLGVGSADREDVQAMGNWRKSTYSGANGGDCVEVASTDVIMVRDTKDRADAMLTMPVEAWQVFTASLK